MLSNKDLYSEIKDMDAYIAKETDSFKKVVVKGITLGLKLLHNLRTNSVAIMKHYNIDLVKPEKETNATEAE